MTMTRETVTQGDRLTRSRLFVGLDQSEMAQRLGRSRATVSNWERGIVDPPFSAMAEWARLTGQSLDWIAFGNREAPAANGEGLESHLSDLNRRPVLYEGTALPLS